MTLRGSGGCGATKYFARLAEGCAGLAMSSGGKLLLRAMLVSFFLAVFVRLWLLADGMYDLRASRGEYSLTCAWLVVRLCWSFVGSVV